MHAKTLAFAVALPLATPYLYEYDFALWSLPAAMLAMRFWRGEAGGAWWLAFVILAFLPWLDTSPVRSGSYRPTFKTFFWILVLDVLILGYCGGSPAEEPYVMISQLASAYYFAHFLIILPIVNHDNSQHAKDENIRLQNVWDGIEVIAGLMSQLGTAWRPVP